MKTQKTSPFDREYLWRCKRSTPEQKLDWLAAAVEFAWTPKKLVQAHGRQSSPH